VSFQTTPPSSVEVRPTAAVAAAFLTQAFIWMFAGLLLTAGVSALVQGSATLLDFARQYLILIFIAQLALVVVISAGINRVAATVALGLFFVYAASLGLTVGLIVSLYTGESVTAAFLSASAIFGGAALYGAITKRSLAGIGGALTMGLFGLVGAMVVNLFLPNGTFGWIISVGGVLLFTVFTAYRRPADPDGRARGDDGLGREGRRDRRAASLPRLRQPLPVPAPADGRPAADLRPDRIPRAPRGLNRIPRHGRRAIPRGNSIGHEAAGPDRVRRMGPHVALAHVAAEIAESTSLFVGLDAFGDDAHTEPVGE